MKEKLLSLDMTYFLTCILCQSWVAYMIYNQLRPELMGAGAFNLLGLLFISQITGWLYFQRCRMDKELEGWLREWDQAHDKASQSLCEFRETLLKEAKSQGKDYNFETIFHISKSAALQCVAGITITVPEVVDDREFDSFIVTKRKSLDCDEVVNCVIGAYKQGILK